MGTGLLTSSGFDPKRLADVLADMRADFQAEFGQSILLDSDTPEGKMMSILSDRLNDIWEIMEAVYNSQYPNGASGTSLDRVLEITGVVRNGATQSTVTLYLAGTPSTSIPIRTLVEVSDAGTQFRTAVAVVLGAIGSLSPAMGTTGLAITSITRVTTVATCTTTAAHGLVTGCVVTVSGATEPEYNVTAEIIVTGASTFTYNMVSDPGGSATGTPVYQDEGLAADHITFNTVVVRDPAHGLSTGDWVFVTLANEDGYNQLAQVTVLDTTHFEYTPSTAPTETPATGSYAADEATPVAGESVDTGAIQGLANTITVIVNPISGWDRVENFLDASLGNVQETDTEARVRRLAALQGLGNATLVAIRGDILLVSDVTAATVFENDTDFTVGSRPPHSIECLVNGGDAADIAQAIFESKAGGIATYGTETPETVVDTQGIEHTINYSRPSDVTIWLDLTLTTDSDYPSDGDTLVEQAVLDFGNALEIGEDVIVYPYLVGAIIDIPGITDVVVDIDITSSPSGDANIIISETEISAWDSSRINIL